MEQKLKVVDDVQKEILSIKNEKMIPEYFINQIDFLTKH